MKSKERHFLICSIIINHGYVDALKIKILPQDWASQQYETNKKKERTRGIIEVLAPSPTVSLTLCDFNFVEPNVDFINDCPKNSTAILNVFCVFFSLVISTCLVNLSYPVSWENRSVTAYAQHHSSSIINQQHYSSFIIHHCLALPCLALPLYSRVLENGF